MKRVMLVCVIVMLCGLLVAQPSNEKRVLKPDTKIVLKDGDYSRNLTGGDLWRELNQYKADKKITHGAYAEQSRGKKTFVIPMAPEVREKLRLQQEFFDRTAVTSQYAPASRASEQTLEIGYNQTWGDTSKFAAYVDALAKIYGSQSERAIHAHLNAGGYVFNYQVKALEFSMDMRNNGNSPTAYTVLRIFGETKFSSTKTFVYNKIFFNGEIGKSVQFFIGPVPVSVRGSIGGQAGFNANLGVAGNGLKGTATPGITSYGKADAGIDLWFVKAGVEGHLDLLIDYLPISATVELLNQNGWVLDIGLKVENQLQALKGKIDVFVDVYELWEDSWERYSMNLFSWTGIQKNWILYDKHYQTPLN